MMHIRCKTCERHLAGPLSKKPLNGSCYHGPHEYSTMAERDYVPEAVRNDYHGLDPLDIITHAQWCAGWATTYSRHKESTVEWFSGITCEESGCCGPRGPIRCSCGVELGLVYADCIDAPPTVHFYHRTVDRSDQKDGHWILKSDHTERWGNFKSGSEHGEWQIFRRNSHGQDLLKIEIWEHGSLIDEVQG